MKNIKPYLLGIFGLFIGAIVATILGESDPPNGVHLIGLFIGSLSAFYLMIVVVARFSVYILKMLGYVDKK